MANTIQVSNGTRQLLEVLKKREHAKTYDEVIQRLAKKHAKTQRSLFGSVKGFQWDKEKDRMRFDGE